MWIFMLDGFFSVVEDKNNPKQLLVRARDEFDAARMGERLGIKPTHTPGPDYDYQWRLFVSREQFAVVMQEEVESIDYTNFKDRVHEQHGYTRAMIYGRVWALLLDAFRQ